MRDIEEEMKKMLDNYAKKPSDVLNDIKGKLKKTATVYPDKIDEDKYKYAISQASKDLSKDIDKINEFCEEILQFLVPSDATEDDRDKLKRIVARQIFASVYLDKLEDMRSKFQEKGFTPGYFEKFDSESPQAKKALSSLTFDASYYAFNPASETENRFKKCTFKDNYSTLNELAFEKKMEDLSIFYFSKHINDEDPPYLDIIKRIRDYLYSSGKIRDLSISDKKEDFYNRVIFNGMKSWYYMNIVLRTELYKEFGIPKSKVYGILGNKTTEMAIRGVCNLEKYDIKHSEDELIKAINDFDNQEKENERLENERKENDKLAQERLMQMYIIKEAVKDIYEKLPKNCSEAEVVDFLIDEKIRELEDELAKVGDEPTPQDMQKVKMVRVLRGKREEIIEKVLREVERIYEEKKQGEHLKKILEGHKENGAKEKNKPKEVKNEEYYLNMSRGSIRRGTSRGMSDATFEKIKNGSLGILAITSILFLPAIGEHITFKKPISPWASHTPTNTTTKSNISAENNTIPVKNGTITINDNDLDNLLVEYTPSEELIELVVNTIEELEQEEGKAQKEVQEKATENGVQENSQEDVASGLPKKDYETQPSPMSMPEHNGTEIAIEKENGDGDKPKRKSRVERHREMGFYNDL